MLHHNSPKRRQTITAILAAGTALAATAALLTLALYSSTPAHTAAAAALGDPPPERVNEEIHHPCDETLFADYGRFGDAAISGLWAVVGRRGDSQTVSSSGALYVYHKVDGKWEHHSKLKDDPP